jgi:hypothetical protein
MVARSSALARGMMVLDDLTIDDHTPHLRGRSDAAARYG